MKGQCFKQWQKLVCLPASYNILPAPPWLCRSFLISDWAVQCFLSQLLAFYKLSIIFLWHNWLCLLRREEPSDSQSHSSAVYISLSHNFSKACIFLLQKMKGNSDMNLKLYSKPPKSSRSWGSSDKCSGFYFQFWSLVVWGFEELSKGHFATEFPSIWMGTGNIPFPIQTEMQMTRNFIIVLEKCYY